MKQKKKKTSVWPFVGIFVILIIVMMIVNLAGEKAILLPVQNNAGAPLLETVGDSLACVFQDGQACVWDWRQLDAGKKDFQLQTNRIVVIKAGVFAAVNQKGRKQLSLIDWDTQKLLQQMDAGFEDQQVWPRISHDKSVLALVRKSLTDSSGRIVFEFAIVETDQNYVGLPVLLNIPKDENLMEYAVGADKVMYAVGRRAEAGRIVAMDLHIRKPVWDRVYPDTKEFCSVIVSPDTQYLLAGNRNGLLYKLDAKTGEIVKQIQLLEEGEMRTITNDYSVLNLAFSPDGKYYVATVDPPAYILRTESDTLVHKFTPANKLVSRVVFSQNNQFVATSDIRAGYPIKVWKMPIESK